MQPTDNQTPSYTQQPNNGAVVSGSQVYAYTAPDVASAPRQSQLVSRHVLRNSLVALAVIVVAFIGGYFTNTGVTHMTASNATATAKNFITALNSGNISTAYKLTSANIQGKHNQTQFEQSIGDIKTANAVLKDASTQVDGKQAVFVATETGLPTASDGSTSGVFTISLIKNGLTGWQVDSVSIE